MTRATSILLLATSLLIVACLGSSLSSDTSAKESLANGALLLDVRTPEEFAEGHVEGAINLPVQDLTARWRELGIPPDREVLVYCRSGARSSRAAKLLKDQGVQQVRDLGRMPNWN